MNIAKIAQNVIDIAAKNIDNKPENFTSATIGLVDAKNLHLNGFHEYALNRAINSLSYSCGIFHPDYQHAVNLRKDFKMLRM